MITHGPFCPCNTYTNTQHWVLLEKSRMPMVVRYGEWQRKLAKLNLDKYIIRAAEQPFHPVFPAQRRQTPHSSIRPSYLKQQKGFVTSSGLYNLPIEDAQMKVTCCCCKIMQVIPLK